MTDFVYEEIGGAGVTIYSLDTGVEITHPEFEGRATWGANFLTGSEDIDDSGHGTHTAATAAGKTFGVAKNANVIAIKVLNDKTGGTIATILAGFDWAINHARETGVAGKAVMNVSLGTWYSAIFNAAATRVVESGIFMAAAAGNHHVSGRFIVFLCLQSA